MPAAILLLFVALLGGSDDRWEKSFPISATGDLKIKTSDANVTTTAWDKNEILVRVTAKDRKVGDGGVGIVDTQVGDNVDIKVSMPKIDFHIGLHTRPVNIEVFAPRSARLNLETRDGKIAVNGAKGDLTLKAGDGDISVQGVEGSLSATAGDGSIKGDGRFDHLRVRTGDGRVEISAVQGSTIASPWQLQTGDGRLTLRLPSNLDADVKLKTRDGHINLQLPLAVTGRVKGKSIAGRLNRGGGLVSAESGDGSIHIESSK